MVLLGTIRSRGLTGTAGAAHAAPTLGSRLLTDPLCGDGSKPQTKGRGEGWVIQDWTSRGKVALVTGGNSGIGIGMADGLAQAGADVCIWGTKEREERPPRSRASRGTARA